MNGSATDRAATLKGYLGVTAAGYDTVTNFGVIAGTSGVALKFAGTHDLLIVEAGSAFRGQVIGGGGAIDLDTGVGTITGLGSPTLTVSGSMAPTTFTGFGSVDIGAGARFATNRRPIDNPAHHYVYVVGSLTIFAGVTNLGYISSFESGRIEFKGAVTNNFYLTARGGTITCDGPVSGTGQVTTEGGTVRFRSSFAENFYFQGGGGRLELAESQAYTSTVFNFSNKGDTSLDLDDIGFVGAGEATFSGGVLTVTDGTHTANINLPGAFTKGFVAAPDGHGGVIVTAAIAGTATVANPLFISALAGFGKPAGGACSVHDTPCRTPPTMLATAR